MTQPTGEHASGVKLASAYVDVGVRTAGAGAGVKRELDEAEAHSKVVSARMGMNISDALSAAGTAGGAKMRTTVANALLAGFDEVSAKGGEQTALKFSAGFQNVLRRSNIGKDIGFVFAGAAEGAQIHGEEVANSYMGRLVQIMGMRRLQVEEEAAKTGEGIAKKLASGAASVGEGFGLGEAFGKASEGLSGLGSKFGEAGEMAGGLGEKLKGLAGPLALFASPEVLGVGGVLAAVGAVGTLGFKVNELGEQWETLGHQIEIQTGATGSNLEKMKDQVQAVYGQVTNSMDEVGGVVSEVNTAFRDSGDGAEKVAVQLAQLQSMVGAIDTTGLGTAFRGYNIQGNAKEQQSVIDQLLKTSQDTRLPVNLLIEAMQRFAPIGDQFHMSMKDSLAMFDEFSRAGINPQNTLFALSRAAKDATDKGKDFGVALKEDLDAIKNAPTEAAAQQAAMSLFGPTSGRGGAAQIVQAVRGGGLSLDADTLAKLEQADGLVNKTRADTMTWGDQWTLFKHKASDALAPVSEGLHEKVQTAMNAVVGFLASHQDQIVHFVNNVVNGMEHVGSALMKAFHEAEPIVAHFFSVVGPHVKNLVVAFGPLVSAIGHDLIPIVKLFGGALLLALEGAEKVLPPVLDFFTHLVHGITDVVHWLNEEVPKAWHVAFDTAKQVIDPIKKAIEEVSHDISVVLKGACDTLGPVFKDLFAGPLAVIQEIAGAIDALIGKLEGPFKSAIDTLKNIGFGPSTPSAPGSPSQGGGIGGTLGAAAQTLANMLPHALGGPIRGQDGLALAGFGGGDIVPALLEPGEHVLTKEEVHGAGGHGNIALLRALIRAGIMPDILGSMTGLGAAALGAGYSSSGPGYQRGGAVGRHRHIELSETEHGIFRVLDKFAATIKKTEKQFEDVNTSIGKITHGTDPLGGLQGLGKTINEVVPEIHSATKAAKQANQAARDFDYGAAADAARGYRPGTVDATRIRDLRPHHVGTAIEHGAVIGQNVRDVTSGLGIGPSEGGVIDSTIDALQTGSDVVGGARDVHGHVKNLHQALKAGDHGAALGHAANALNSATQIGKALGVGGGGGWVDEATDRVGNVINNASNAHFAMTSLAAGAKALAGTSAAKAIGAKVIPQAARGALGAAGAGAAELAGPVTVGVVAGREISQALDKQKWYHDQMYNADGTPKSSVERWVRRQPVLGAAAKWLEGFAGGGFLPGYSDHDNMLGMIPGFGMFGLAGGEGIIKARVAQQPWVRKIIQILNKGYATGTGNAGGIDEFVASMQGTPYSQGARNDCSGMASQIANVALGLPPRSSMFTTRNEGEWLAAHGFIMGNGPAGSLRIGWYNHGSDPNDGHTAVTLPDGRPAESGGSHGNFLAGAGAAGAEASEFDHHAYLPLNPQGPAVGGTGSGARSPVAAVSGGFSGGGTPDTSGGSAGDSGGGTGGGTDYAGTFGDMIAGGLKENMLPGFSDPTQWGGVKSAAALMKFLATASGQPGSPLAALAAARGSQGAAGLNLFGDLLSGSGSGVAHDFMDLVGVSASGALPQAHGAPGASPDATPGPVINHNVTYNGDIHDKPTHDDGLAAVQARQTLQTWRMTT